MFGIRNENTDSFCKCVLRVCQNREKYIISIYVNKINCRNVYPHSLIRLNKKFDKTFFVYVKCQGKVCVKENNKRYINNISFIIIIKILYLL